MRTPSWPSSAACPAAARQHSGLRLALSSWAQAAGRTLARCAPAFLQQTKSTKSLYPLRFEMDKSCPELRSCRSLSGLRPLGTHLFDAAQFFCYSRGSRDSVRTSVGEAHSHALPLDTSPKVTERMIGQSDLFHRTKKGVPGQCTRTLLSQTEKPAFYSFTPPSIRI